MKKNKAFTLAEVLITLGIIGVIAALTMPALIQGANKAKVGPELANALNTLENGVQQFLNDYNADYVSVAMTKAGASEVTVGSLFTDYLFSTDNPYIKGSEDSDPPTTCMCLNSTDDSLTIGTAASIAAYILANKSLINPLSGNCKLTSDSGCKIYFFTSGYKKKQDDNKLILGRDVFEFFLKNNGEVIPAGQIGSNTGGEWDTWCSDQQLKKGLATGAYCTGRIAANGWKVDY